MLSKARKPIPRRESAAPKNSRKRSATWDTRSRSHQSNPRPSKNSKGDFQGSATTNAELAATVVSRPRGSVTPDNVAPGNGAPGNVTADDVTPDNVTPNSVTAR